MIKYFAKPKEDIANTRPDGRPAWNSQLIEVFQQENDQDAVKIGEYTRNYHTLMQTFFAFKHANEKWYALYSPDYTATRVMELPSCKDIGGEESNGHGFCPMEYYVPTYIDFKYDDHEPIRCSQVDEHDVKETELNTENDIKYWHFGFVGGCVWGDDWSTKVEYLDLSKADQGVITRSPKLGYVWLPPNMKLKDAIDMDGFEKENYPISIATSIRFRNGSDYSNFDLSDISDHIEMRRKQLRHCTYCDVEEGTPHLDSCQLFNIKHPNESFIYYPRVCRRCGQVNPSKFLVNSKIWKKYIPYIQQSHPLCLKCFLHIQSIIDKKEHTWVKDACLFCGSTKIITEYDKKKQPFSKICTECQSGWW